MKTIEKAVQSEINIKKSQFICSLFPTKTKKEISNIMMLPITAQHTLQMTVKVMMTTVNQAELQANL